MLSAMIVPVSAWIYASLAPCAEYLLALHTGFHRHVSPSQQKLPRVSV